MTIRLLTILFLLQFSYTSVAQEVKNRCGFDKIYRKLQTDSAYLARRNQLKKTTASRIEKASNTITIPVVIHLIYKNPTENISDAQILSQIEVLNEDYRMRNADTTNVEANFSKADTEIEFCLAKYDPNNQPTNGIIRYQTTIDDIGNTNKYYTVAPIWDRDFYLNIWVCDLGPTNAGFSFGPGAAADKDGVVIHYSNFGNRGNVMSPYDLGRTTTHEVGHWLNLLHPWGTTTNCSSSDGDKVNDTPIQEKPYFNCPTPPKNSCGSKDMLSNFMGYVDDACMGNFTKGQKDRIHDAILTYRSTLLQSNGCGSVGLSANTKRFENDIQLFPNPASDYTNVVFKNARLPQQMELSLYNFSGKKIAVNKQKTNNGYRINFNHLPEGIYLLRLKSKKEQVLKKLTITQ